MIHTSSLIVDRAGLIRPDLIPLAAFLCAEAYDDASRSVILDHAAAGAPLADLTRPTPEGHLILEPSHLDDALAALRRGGPAPAPIAGGAPALADQVAAEADRLRRTASPVAGFLADQLDRLAQLIAFTGARTSQDFADRLEAHEGALLAAEYDRGFRDGRSRSAGYCPR